jgi:hypothetical protein
MGICCADHATPLYQLKLALTSPAGCGRSVGIVRLRTKATEFSLVLEYRTMEKSENPVILCVIHHHQNALESTLSPPFTNLATVESFV